MKYVVMPLSDWQDILDSVKAKTGKSDALVSGDVSSEIDGIGGVELPALTNEGAESDLMQGKQMINSRGEAVTGKFTLENEMSAQDGLIAKIKAALKGKAAGGGGDLPKGYTRVDFIEFTGKQFVDTGIIGNQDTQIDVSFTWGNATQNHVFGCASSDNTASITSYMNGSWRFGAKSATKSIMKNNTVLPYAARVNKSMIGVTNSNTAISDVNDFETPGTLLLGGARSSNGALPSTGFVGRVFYFRDWSGSTQIMNLVPVTDGTAFRFYDLITRTFFDSITDTPLEGGNL